MRFRYLDMYPLHQLTGLWGRVLAGSDRFETQKSGENGSVAYGCLQPKVGRAAAREPRLPIRLTNPEATAGRSALALLLDNIEETTWRS